MGFLMDVLISGLVAENGARLSPVESALKKYNDPTRKWHNLKYLRLGLKEHERLLGMLPQRDALAAWLYHSYELGSEEASAVAFLRDAAALGFSFEDAERYMTFLIVGCRPSSPPSSTIGDMRIAVLGQDKDSYLSYAAALREEWAFIGESAWFLGRSAALRYLLTKNPLYFRPEFESSLAIKARENMQEELAFISTS